MYLFLHLLLFTPFISPAFGTSRNKFQEWFPKYRDYFEDVSEQCSAEIERYRTDNRSLSSAPCAAALDCLLENSSESVKTNLGSANVMLGLLPTLLAFVGPTIEETAAVSVAKPALAVLLSFGAPGPNVGSLFGSFQSEGVRHGRNTAVARALWRFLRRRGSVVRVAFVALEYVVALAAIANVVTMAIQLDRRTVSAFKCGQEQMPLIWGLVGIPIHLFGMLAIRMRSGVPMRKPGALDYTSENTNGTVLSDLLYWVASFCALIHMIFGVLVFSTLIFISAVDTLPVMVRYGVSAICCQAVLLLECCFMTASQDNSLSEEGPENGFQTSHEQDKASAVDR